MCESVYLYACHVYPHTVIPKIICEMSLRYDAQRDTLYAASVLDPRFKARPSLSASEMTPSPGCSLRLPNTVQFNKNVVIEN